MKNEYADLFHQSPCPSQEELLNYVQGNLDGKALHEMERHLNHCADCQDAVSGLQSFKDTKAIPNHIRQVKWKLMLQLRWRNHHRAKPILGNYTSIIALFIILLIAFSIYLIWVNTSN
jgi:hypothetical protein